MKLICQSCKKEFEHKRKRKQCIECTPLRKHFNSEEEKLTALRKRRVKSVQKRRHKLKYLAIKYKGEKCSICNYNKCKDALEFHHIDPKEKDFIISDRSISFTWDEAKKELDKCIVVCSNCHREIHAGIRKIEESNL